MKARFSRDESIGARRQWEEVSIFNQGKTTTREWRDFEASFISAWQEVDGATKGEARRLLLQKVPSFILRWITEEEERRSFTNPTIRMNSPWDMTEGEMGDSLFVLIGKRATKVTKSRGGDFDIVLPDFGDIDKMLSYNGKSFRDTSMVVKVSRVEKVLDFEDIFLLVNHKLALRDRQDLLASANQSVSSGRQARARAVAVEPKEDKPKNQQGGGKPANPPMSTIPTAPKASSAPSTPVEKGGQTVKSTQATQHSAPSTPTFGKEPAKGGVHGPEIIISPPHGISVGGVLKYNGILNGRDPMGDGKDRTMAGIPRKVGGKDKTPVGRDPILDGKARRGTPHKERETTREVEREKGSPMERGEAGEGEFRARGAGVRVLGDWQPQAPHSPVVR